LDRSIRPTQKAGVLSRPFQPLFGYLEVLFCEIALQGHGFRVSTLELKFGSLEVRFSRMDTWKPGFPEWIHGSPVFQDGSLELENGSLEIRPPFRIHGHVMINLGRRRTITQAERTLEHLHRAGSNPKYS
jgi:hypothetical protein